MFELIKKAKLEVDYFLKRRSLEKQKDRDYKILRNRKQFEVDKEGLQNEVQLEELKADIRKNQQKSLPKPGQILQKKSAFAGFMDYAEKFAKQQEQYDGGNYGTRKKKKNTVSGSRFGF